MILFLEQPLAKPEGWLIINLLGDDLPPAHLRRSHTWLKLGISNFTRFSPSPVHYEFRNHMISLEVMSDENRGLVKRRDFAKGFS